jgi:hypothetical protein
MPAAAREPIRDQLGRSFDNVRWWIRDVSTKLSIDEQQMAISDQYQFKRSTS